MSIPFSAAPADWVDDPDRVVSLIDSNGDEIGHFSKYYLHDLDTGEKSPAHPPDQTANDNVASARIEDTSVPEIVEEVSQQ